MALRLLEQQALCCQPGADITVLLCPWVDALPRQVSEAAISLLTKVLGNLFSAVHQL